MAVTGDLVRSGGHHGRYSAKRRPARTIGGIGVGVRLGGAEPDAFCRPEAGGGSEAVAQQDLIDGLIATYRELNNRVRPLPEERLTMPDANGATIRDVLVRLRDQELKFSQALKERISGGSVADLFSDVEAGVLGTESSHDSSVVVLSQFGTARESTLAMLRGLDPAAWTDSSDGGRSIADSIRQLVQHDRRQVERINGLLGSP